MIIFLRNLIVKYTTYSKSRAFAATFAPSNLKFPGLKPTMLSPRAVTHFSVNTKTGVVPAISSSSVDHEHQVFLNELAVPRMKDLPASSVLPVRNLVLKGGGPKGLAYVTALKTLEETLGTLAGIYRVAGSSAGSMVSALVAVGYTPAEIKALLEERDEQGRPILLRFALDSDDLEDDYAMVSAINAASNSWFPKARFLWEVVSSLRLSQKLFTQGGLCRGEYVRRWLNDKLSAKIIEIESQDVHDAEQLADIKKRYQQPTLAQLKALIENQASRKQHPYKHLYVVVAQQINNRASCHIYTSEKIWGRPTQVKITDALQGNIEDESSQLMIADVVRSSMAIPGFFTAGELQGQSHHGKLIKVLNQLFIDGGIVDNYPINLFDYNVYHSLPNFDLPSPAYLPNPETLGLYLYDKADQSVWRKLQNSLGVLIRKKLQMPSTVPPTRLIAEDLADLPRHINIDNGKVGLLDFNLPADKQQALLASGEDSVHSFFLTDAGKLKTKQDDMSRDHYGNYLKKPEPYKQWSNIDKSPVRADYVIHPQYYQMIAKIKGSGRLQAYINLSGIGGSGKTELAKYVAVRYRDAHLWTQWRLGNNAPVVPIIWFFAAENSMFLWNSCKDLASKLSLEIPNLDRRAFNGSDTLWQDFVKHEIERLLSRINEKSLSRHALYLFDNAESLLSDTEHYPAVAFYLKHLTTSHTWHLITTRNAAFLDSSYRPVNIDLDEGLGEVRANELLLQVLPKPCIPNDKAILNDVTRTLYYLPLSIQIMGDYLRDTPLTLEAYLKLHQQQFITLEKAFSHAAKHSINAKNLSQVATIELAIETLKSNSTAAYELLQFCSFLNPDRISRALLHAFIVKTQPSWREDHIDSHLESQLNVLATLLKPIEGEVISSVAERSYKVHRLVQQLTLSPTMLSDHQTVDKALLTRIIATLLDFNPDSRGNRLIHPRLKDHYWHAWFRSGTKLEELDEKTTLKIFAAVSLLLKTSAGLDNAISQYKVSFCYYDGFLLEKDLAQAFIWGKKAAEQGHAQAQNNLGVLYDKGEGVAQDFTQAAAWYRKAAEQGDAEAQFNLGVCYRKGKGVAQDFTQSVAWYRKAAEQGLAESQNNLGVCYDKGDGVEQDFTQAVAWYRKAAEQEFAQAQHNLGVCYATGQGVAQDFTQAVAWYRKAAEQGYARAQYSLGVCCENGDGMIQDSAEAIKWFKQSASQGFQPAQASLHRLLQHKKLSSITENPNTFFHSSSQNIESTENSKALRNHGILDLNAVPKR